jgi:ribosomal protein L21E
MEMAKFKIGDKVRMDPFISGDRDQYVKFRNKVGTIVGVGNWQYDVVFPENPGEAYEFDEDEMTLAKSLPATKALENFKIGDKVLVLPGNYRSGKVGTVVAFQDGDPAVQLEGLPEPEMFAEYELRLEKSLPIVKAYAREGNIRGKSLPATKSLPQCSFCGKSLAGGSEVLEGSRRYHTKCFPSTSSVALRAKYIVRD